MFPSSQLPNIDQIDYFGSVEHLRSRISQPELRSFFNNVLSNEPNSFQPTTSIAKEINQAYVSIWPSRQTEYPDFKTSFDSFLNAAKASLSTEQYILFMRYLSLYMTGKLPHQIFIRLFLNFFRSKNQDISQIPIIHYLPSFLSTLSCSSFFTEKDDLPSIVQDKFAIETLLKITSPITSPQVSKSISKCLACLSTGLISKEIAQEWLSDHCSPEIVEKFNEIDDFSYLNPSRFPHELILCPDFQTTDKNRSICEQFVDFEKSLKPFSSYKPFIRELCEIKMRGLRKSIRKLMKGGTLTAEELFFAYGNDAYAIVDYVPQYNSYIIERLGKKYEETQKILSSILHYQMSLFSPNDPEFRYQFKRLLKHETYAFHYLLPGQREINFGKESAAHTAFSLVHDFSNSYFDELQSSKIQRGLEILGVIINGENKGHFYVVDEHQIISLVYLAAIARLLLTYGDTDEIVFDDNRSIMNVEQPTEFGQKLAKLPLVIKESDGLVKLFQDSPLQHVDLHITRCARQLYIFDDVENLPEFPEKLDSSFLITTMNLIGEKEEKNTEEEKDENEEVHEKKSEYIVQCSTAFSPCYIEFASDGSDEQNPANSNSQEKD